MLEVRGLTKQFGALRASDGIDFDVAEGETHAVIGPNGAGKTTFIGQLAGNLRPDSGTVRFAGADITAFPAPRRARLGLARSFQITSVYPDFSVLQNVALAIQAHAGHSFRFWRDARSDPALIEPAKKTLNDLGLAERSQVLAGNLAHGEQRQLEGAIALATAPRLLLLDEDDGVQARRPHLGAGLRPPDRQRHAREDPGERGSAAGVPGDGGLMLEVRALQTSYGRSQVLFGVDFCVPNEKVVTLLGRNGMGKTTTVRSVMGIVPPRSGTISFQGRSLEGLASYRIAQAGLGLVPEGRQ